MKFLTDKSGQLYKVPDEDAELVTEDERVKLLAEAQAEVAMLQAAAPADQGSPSNSSTDSADGSQSLASSI